MSALLVALVSAALGALLVLGLWSHCSRDMAHEVKRPMTALLLAAESCRGHLLTGELNAIQEQVRRASLLLDSADPVTSLLAKAFKREQTVRLPFSEALESMAAAWQPAARVLGREILLEERSTHAGLVDATALDSGLGNLVANALEHGSGPVVVQSSSRAGEGATLEVANSGGGSPSVQHSRRSRGRGQRIASGQVRRLGGRLTAWSEATGRAQIDLGGERSWS